tara:strand:+ start:4178 stop:5182 length:1005 start_codon:yes stop_codon:yes gene_type:complete
MKIRKVAIVGSGLSGAVCARILHDRGFDVEVFESRPKAGGNCADTYDPDTKIHVQDHGPHVFHTNSNKVWGFMSEHCTFNDFKAVVHGRLKDGSIIPLPFNRESVEVVGDWSSKNIKDGVFRHYSMKQWGVEWCDMAESITKRVPTKRDTDSPYWHNDKYQGVPIGGYTGMFQRLLSGIVVHYAVPKDAWKSADYDILIYTGKLDAYFDYKHGRLPYRSLDFVKREIPAQSKHFQLNECNMKNSWTREVDHSFFSGKPHFGKSISIREYPCEHTDNNIAYYPMRGFVHGDEVYEKYKVEAEESDTLFVGRLAEYKYIDMDVAVGCAMKVAENIK